MKKSSVYRMQRFMYSQILSYVLERWIITQYQILFGNESWNGSKIHHNTEHWTQSTEEPLEFEWNMFPGFTTLQLVQEVQQFMNKMGEPEQFQGRIIFMPIFNDIKWRLLMGTCSSNYSEWNIDEKWSSQQWKSDEMLEARTERPVSEQLAGLFTQHTDKFVIDDDNMDCNTARESDLSLKSRSFLHRWMIECERSWTNLPKMQCKTATNIL